MIIDQSQTLNEQLAFSEEKEDGRRVSKSVLKSISTWRTILSILSIGISLVTANPYISLFANFGEMVGNLVLSKISKRGISWSSLAIDLMSISISVGGIRKKIRNIDEIIDINIDFWKKSLKSENYKNFEHFASMNTFANEKTARNALKFLFSDKADDVFLKNNAIEYALNENKVWFNELYNGTSNINSKWFKKQLNPLWKDMRSLRWTGSFDDNDMILKRMEKVKEWNEFIEETKRFKDFGYTFNINDSDPKFVDPRLTPNMFLNNKNYKIRNKTKWMTKEEFDNLIKPTESEVLKNKFSYKKPNELRNLRIDERGRENFNYQKIIKERYKTNKINQNNPLKTQRLRNIDVDRFKHRTLERNTLRSIDPQQPEYLQAILSAKERNVRVKHNVFSVYAGKDKKINKRRFKDILLKLVESDTNKILYSNILKKEITLKKNLFKNEMRKYFKGIRTNNFNKLAPAQQKYNFSVVEDKIKRIIALEQRAKDISGLHKLNAEKFLNKVSEFARRDEFYFFKRLRKVQENIKGKFLKNLKTGFFPNNALFDKARQAKRQSFLYEKFEDLFDADQQMEIQAIFNKMIYTKNDEESINYLMEVLEQNYNQEQRDFIFDMIKTKSKSNVIRLDRQVNMRTFFDETSKVLNRKDVSWKEKFIKMLGTEKFNDNVIQSTSSFFSASDAGRNLMEYLNKKVKTLIQRKLYRFPRAIKAGYKASEQITKIRKAFVKAGGVVIESRYLLGYKIYDQTTKKTEFINNFAKLRVKMYYNPINTRSKKGKNVNGKPPHLIYATLRDLRNLNKYGSEYYFDYGKQKGWFVSYGGKTSNVLSTKIRKINYFLNYIPINSMRRFFSLPSNIIEGIANPDQTFIGALNGNKDWYNQFKRSSAKVGISRLGRIGFRYIIGTMYQKSLAKTILKNAKPVKTITAKGTRKVVYKTGHKWALDASRKKVARKMIILQK